MRACRFASFLSILVFPTLADAVDLTKIDRRIRVEPKYKTAAPRYCLIVFGIKAEKRVWLVRDGQLAIEHVVVAGRQGDHILVHGDESGISGGEKAVVSPLAGAVAGAAVKEIDAAQPEATGGS